MDGAGSILEVKEDKTETLNHSKSHNQDSVDQHSTDSETSKVQNVSIKEDETNKDSEAQKSTEFASQVAAHYNSLENNDAQDRHESKIFYLRNFNNWIKSILIKTCVKQLSETERYLKVLDMCCGKGGDLLKWLKSDTRYLICTDIAENSLEQYKVRYKTIMEKRDWKPMLECEFIPADCTRVRLRSKYRDPTIKLNIVSCQFCFHYCFESLPQAECMLKNASECLKPGGLFIGTIPNAYEIVKRLRKFNTNHFGNDIFKIEMCCSEPYPIFGAKYKFYLEGVVDCPEFLVHFPTFEKLALKFGLKLVKREQFTELFKKHSVMRDGKDLLKRMKALETFPLGEEKELTGPRSDYVHAEVYCEQYRARHVGTLSKSEWEVVSLYQSFVFEKIKTE